ncbi:helix-turn-helix domain-containing protein [Larkinella rosea]|uniref:Helix-turn-helix domain-containing protein n=1 Tax=Larkinella rosea TaxID=2025312 RepID=A0A3P1C2J6_9BACT|nr:helix-turn-helix domain-containing protein [Larkinella rosea]RRB07605.1 helix-turn-helix domain-containing protein [Larkinella rosea]
MVTSEKAFVEKLNRLIDDNLDNSSFTVETICQSLGISRSQLHRTLKEQTDLSTTLYIRKRRLLKARQLLTSSSLRIAEIGDLVGITNPQNFSSYFIDEFKLSPTEFRKQRLQSSEDEANSGAVSAEPELPDLSVEDQPAEETAGQPRFKNRRRLVFAGLAATLAVIIGAGLFVWYQTRSLSPSAQTARHSLAVLPFTNLGAADSSPACDGIMDDVHTSISLIQNLKVIARSSSDQYRDTKKSIWQIGDELRVTNILKGSVLKTGEQIQIKVELINTQEDIRLWGKTYRAAYSELFSLTDQVVRDIARQLTPRLNPGQAAPLKRLPTHNLAAYQEYIKGKQLVLARTGDKLRASVTLLNRAIALDSSFADAYAARASAYLIMGDFKVLDKKTGFKLAENDALNAIRLDGTNGTAYGVLANLYRLQYKWDQALTTFRIALKYSPNDAQINFWYGITLRSIGRFDQAIQYEAKAVALNPLYPAALIGLISTYANAGRYELARKAIQDGEPLFDDAYMYHYARSFYHLNRREYPQAVAAMRISDSLSHSAKTLDYYRLYLRARVLPKNRFETELKTVAPTIDTYHDLAYAYAGLEDSDNCLKYLQLSIDHKLAPDYLKVAPFFAFLHRDPRFIEILRQCNLAEYP